ncbi:DUF2130 domain-containing protein [Pseudoalteromonas sp. HF66]|uniref:DUF2130 domain-containing protein n=1 Tax=Pseudoalteromonas sp. HF66 TaxID=2721559 RepID=UPI0014311552|nr:DUF2130 domain-containing protein [Pseudoalteromonas sp. HF66]NIZ05471.1 DUF2130 domain-containing protein [Pseudoalteromonas sp. HF66]
MNSKIILNADDQIACPHCNSEFPIKEAVAKHLIEKHEDEYQQLLSKELVSLQEQAAKDAEKSIAKTFKKQIETLQEQLAESQDSAKSLQARITEEKKKAEDKIRESVKLEHDALEESLKSKEEQLAKFREQELALRKAKTELEDKQKDMELELARRVESEKESLRASIGDEFRLKEAELRKKIDDASKANEDLKRKLEQGSQQLQGEVLELELEHELAQAYPLDDIDPVGKGTRGADVIQTVRLRTGTVCGKIVWETKRAENWSNGWITKLKADTQEVSGDIAVLVSTAFPAGIEEPMVMKDGVWLVKPALAKGLSEALRTVLTEAQRQKAVSVGKNEQMEALYDYICSTQFVQRIKAVVDHQEQMRLELDKEKSAMQRIWKKREGQIGGITNQMMAICGELQGLSHGSMPLLDDIALLGD